MCVCASMHICVSLSCYLEASTVLVVSCPDPALSQGKGSGDYWAISWLCRLSSIDFWMDVNYMLAWLKAISLAYVHAWMTWHYVFHWLVQNQDCWLSTTKKSLNSHQTLFLVRGRGLGTRPWFWESGCTFRAFLVLASSLSPRADLLVVKKKNSYMNN